LLRLGGALTNFPYELRLKKFFRPGGVSAPTAFPGYACGRHSSLTSILARCSALEVFTIMRYINIHFTYLLTYLLTVQQW